MYIPRIWLLDVPTIWIPVPYIALCTADPSASGLKALKTKLPKDWFDRLKTPPQNTQTQCTSLYTSGIFENMLADLAGRQLFFFKWDKEKNEHRNIFLPCGSDVFPGAGESQRPTQVKPGILLKAAVNYFCLTCHKPFHNDEPLPVVNNVFSL